MFGKGDDASMMKGGHGDPTPGRGRGGEAAAHQQQPGKGGPPPHGGPHGGPNGALGAHHRPGPYDSVKGVKGGPPPGMPGPYDMGKGGKGPLPGDPNFSPMKGMLPHPKGGDPNFSPMKGMLPHPRFERGDQRIKN